MTKCFLIMFQNRNKLPWHLGTSLPRYLNNTFSSNFLRNKNRNCKTVRGQAPSQYSTKNKIQLSNASLRIPIIVFLPIPDYRIRQSQGLGCIFLRVALFLALKSRVGNRKLGWKDIASVPAELARGDINQT